MSAHDALRKGIATAHNVLVRQFMPGTVVKLLRPSETYGEYDEILTLSGKWFFEYGATRKEIALQIADNDPDLAVALGDDSDAQTATHVRIDDDLYVIRTGDTKPPKGTDVTWKVFGDEDEKPTEQFKSMR